jgi:DNA ligase-associated metallophosphoesterase
MAERVPLMVAGEQVELHADRALCWPARRRLVVADLHLGKADTFRRAGIALPSGGTAHDLSRLDRLLQATGAQALWVLGDMLHGDPGPRRWRVGWDGFRDRWPQLDIVVVAGNHDRALHGAGLGVRIETGAVSDGPFVFRHDPADDPRGLVLCGHVHPVVRPPGIRRRFPAFVLGRRCGVLPAFSAFSGGCEVAAGAGCRRLACVDGAVLELPGAAGDR